METASSGKHRLLIIKYAVDKGVGVNITTPYRVSPRSERFHTHLLNTNTYYKIYKSY